MRGFISGLSILFHWSIFLLNFQTLASNNIENRLRKITNTFLDIFFFQTIANGGLFFLINCVQFRNIFHIHYSWTFSYNGKYSEHFTIFHNDIFKFVFHSILIYCVYLFLCTLRKMSKWFSSTFSLQKVSFHKGRTVKKIKQYQFSVLLPSKATCGIN